MTTARPLPPAVAAAKGLSPAERARAVAHAKGVAFRVVNAVLNEDAAALQRVAAEVAEVAQEAPEEAWAQVWAQVWALVVVLAEVADRHRLKLLQDITDDGLPSHVGGERRSA